MKRLRLENYDYNQNGAYFITFCVKDRRELLGKIVGRGILDAPSVQLSEYGNNIIAVFEFFNKKSDAITVNKHVIMPNHVHLIVLVNKGDCAEQIGGASGKPRPTNALIPKFVSSIKRYTNKLAGFDMWQSSYHDRIIRDEKEYLQVWQYIDDNPSKWREDEYFVV